MPLKPVDAAITVIVGPLVDDADFKTLETAIAHDAPGMDLDLIVEKADGTTVTTDITPTSGGANDWTHKAGGYYELEITAAQNAEEGVLRVVGVSTGVLPFASAAYDVVPALVYDSLVKGTDKLQVDAQQIEGSDATEQLAAAAATLLDLADGVESGKTVRQALRYMAAMLAGKVAGAGTGTETFRGIDGATDRVQVTVDEAGNRTAIEYDPA